MFNVVEIGAGDDEQHASPCKYGNIVDGHACYCHADHWVDGPRKCHIWRLHGENPVFWRRQEWAIGDRVRRIWWDADGKEHKETYKSQVPPDREDDDIGCPEFVPAERTNVQHSEKT